MSDLIKELEMWAKRDPTDTSVPFGKLFTRAAMELKRLEADLVDRIKGEQAAWNSVKHRNEIEQLKLHIKENLVEIGQKDALLADIHQMLAGGHFVGKKRLDWITRFRGQYTRGVQCRICGKADLFEDVNDGSEPVGWLNEIQSEKD